MYKRVIIAAVTVIASLCIFTGCIPNDYTREEENALVKEAEKIAADYLESAYDGAVIKEINAETSVEDSAYVLTEFARGWFSWQGQTYAFVVSVETGEVYTSVCLNEIQKGLKEALIQELGIDSREAEVINYEIYYRKGLKEKNVERSTFFCVFPEGETAKDLLQEVLTDAEAYYFSIMIQYKGGDIPQEIIKGDAPFPTLYEISIYHIAEEYELYEGRAAVRENLPVLSKEILQRNYGKDSAKYTKNQVIERNGLRVVYDAYEWKREQESVTEAVIDEEDISLTMTKESIVLDCTKEHFCMYLLTTDGKIAEKYLHTIPVNSTGKETLRNGIWYPYGDIYIYSDIYHDTDIENRTTHKFNDNQRTANIIYSGDGA
ncbi:MAG: hypothetical protein NC434_11520 [Ruminococcus sp.]|nr:hypothetical protein [Ruminococcus sp.]